jgi:hypothetical protein
MTYEMKTLSCNPAKLKDLSEKLIVSHYENNYGGAVKRRCIACLIFRTSRATSIRKICPEKNIMASQSKPRWLVVTVRENRARDSSSAATQQ